jgi:agmatinase
MHDAFDPDAPSDAESLFGLPHTPDEAHFVVVPVPWEVTTSYHRGTANGPARVLAGSWQVDLFLPRAPDLWRRGIALEPADPRIGDLQASVVDDALAVIEGDPDPARLQRVNDASKAVDDIVYARIAALFRDGKVPVVLGGDHSVSFGAIRAVVEHEPRVGILHIDAHADLRVAYQGFERSHASIMYNALAHTGLERLVQVGLRDFGRAEWEVIQSDSRIRAHTWRDLARSLSDGVSWSALAHRIISDLPATVWISFDIDGLDPVLCPSTGTPVPGGLGWDQAMRLLEMLRESGRTVIGFDLVEVGDGTLDGNVGARLLYQLCATAEPPMHGAS